MKVYRKKRGCVKREERGVCKVNHDIRTFQENVVEGKFE